MTDHKNPETLDAQAGRTVGGAIDGFQGHVEREENFRFLYEVFFPPVQRFFRRKGFAPEDCLDLTQETLLGIYKGLDGYRREARFETWLYRIATTVYLKRLRSAATDKRAGHEIPYEEGTPESFGLKSPPGQLDSVLEDEKRRAMREAVRRLPEQMQRCLTLRLYQELKYREIATVMKLKIDTVKAHLFQARRRLAKDLRQYSFEILDVDEDSPDEGTSADCPEVRLVAVAPAGRGRGVGRALMEACVERARSSGAPGLVLHTMAMMIAARSLYDSMGFGRAPELDFQPAREWFLEGFRLDFSQH